MCIRDRVLCWSRCRSPCRWATRRLPGDAPVVQPGDVAGAAIFAFKTASPRCAGAGLSAGHGRAFRPYTSAAPAADGNTIWVHAVSLGEARAAAVLVASLRARLPGMRL